MGAAAEGTTDALSEPTAQVGTPDATSVSASKMASDDLIITPQSTVTITGSVAAYPSGTPLIAGATVTVTCTGCNNSPTVSYTGGGTSTNATGGFSVSVTYPGSGPATVTLTASAPGYTSVSQSSDSRTCTGNGSSCTASPVTLLLAPPLRADLSVAKSDGVPSVVAGDGVVRTFTITVANAGPSTATGVTLTDTWPAGYARGTITPPPGVTCPDVSGGPSFSCNLGTIAAGTNKVVTVSYSVPASTPAGSQSNRAVVSSTSTDPNTTNNTATDTNTVSRSADLSVTKTDGVTSVVAGATTPYTFTITVANAGPSDASGVVLTDTWPSGYTRGTITPPGGVTCPDVSGGPSFRCNLGTIAAGTNKVVTVTYTVPASTSGTRTNTGVATSSTADPNSANNTGTDTNTITQPADLSVTKTDGVTTVTAGVATPLTFTITVRNLGPGTAAAVTLTDTWPAGYTRGAIAPSQGACTGVPSFSCALGSLASGGSATVTVAYTVPASTPAGNQSNIAAVSSTTADLVPTNNTATDTNTVLTSADLSVTKTASPEPVLAGANLTYTITVTNNGPSAAQGVSLADVLPVSLTNATYCTSVACDPATGGAWSSPLTLGTLAAGASTTVKYPRPGRDRCRPWHQQHGHRLRHDRRPEPRQQQCHRDHDLGGVRCGRDADRGAEPGERGAHVHDHGAGGLGFGSGRLCGWWHGRLHVDRAWWFAGGGVVHPVGWRDVHGGAELGHAGDRHADRDGAERDRGRRREDGGPDPGR